MAYNPFNIFRRNQKAIFAVVTVIIMFVFVMSSGLSGGADFFDWLPRWLGQKSKKGDGVCKLDGDRIYESDLSKLSFQRVMANRFMYRAASEAASSLRQFADQQTNQITDPESRRLLTDGPNAIMQLRDPRFQFMRTIPQFASRIKQLEESAAAYSALANSPTAKPAEKEIVRARQYQALLEEQVGRARGELYFFNAPNRTRTDLIDFMLWQKKADQLGISFTAADVNQLIQKEFYGFFRSEVAVRKELMAQINGFSFEACLKAIAEEFRVRTAQQVILGPGLVYLSGDKLNGATIFNTPYEMFEFYRDKCSPTDYEVIPVPAAGFIDKVVGEPSDDELKRLYDQYKDDEPNPGRETPGFKTPRQVKLEWVSATGSEPYYQKLAEESLKVGELQAKIGSMMTVPLLGGSPGWVVAATGPLIPKDLLLAANSVRSDYATSVTDQHNMTLDSNWTNPTSSMTRLLDTSVVRPPTLVAALGGFAGGSLTLAGPLSGIGTFETAVRAFELRDRIRAGAPLVFGAVPGPGMLATMIGGEATLRTMLPKPLPIEVTRPELIKHLTEQTAKQLLLADLKTFSTKVAELAARFKFTDQSVIALQNEKVPETVITKLNTLKNKEFSQEEFVGELTKALNADELKQFQTPITTSAELPGAAKDKGPALKYIAEFAAARGWQHGVSEKLRNEWTLEEDPGLASLRAVLTKSPHGNLPVRFGQKFFWTDETRGPRTPVTGTYKPEYYPNAPSSFESPAAQEPKFLVWRTEETRAQPAPSFLAAKELVRAAWKRIKARDLAKNRAEALANAMRTSAGDVPELIDQNLRELANTLRNEITDPKVRDRVLVFSIDGVCPLTGERAGGLRPFQITSSSDIPYPNIRAMTETLLDERTKPPKTTLVLTDLPKDTYYVVTLKRRDVKKVDDFKLVYVDLSFGGENAISQTHRVVMDNFIVDAQKKTMESIMGLLKQEFKYEATDEQKKKLEENEKRGGGDE